MGDSSGDPMGYPNEDPIGFPTGYPMGCPRDIAWVWISRGVTHGIWCAVCPKGMGPVAGGERKKGEIVTLNRGKY